MNMSAPSALSSENSRMRSYMPLSRIRSSHSGLMSVPSVMSGSPSLPLFLSIMSLPRRMMSGRISSRPRRQPGAHAARMTALAVAEHGHKQPRGGCVCLVVAPGAVEHLSQGGYTRGIVEFQQPQSEGRYQLHACAVAGGAVGAEQGV